MNLDHLREFVFLTKTLSFRETARHFYLSQSVLSKHIASLEDELGTQLFVRDSHHVRTTPQGRVFAEDARTILGDYERALLNIAAVSDDRKSALRIGYLRGAARPVLKRFVSYLDRAFPDYALNLRCLEYEGLVDAVATNLVDAAITVDFGDMGPEVDSFVLYRDEMRVIVAPSHPLAKFDSLRSEMLEGQKLLLPDRKGYQGMSEFVDALLPEGRPPRAETYLDVDTLFMRVQEQGCVGFSSAHHMLSHGDSLCFKRLDDRDASYDVCLFVRTALDPAAAGACLDAGEHCAAYLRKQNVVDDSGLLI